MTPEKSSKGGLSALLGPSLDRAEASGEGDEAEPDIEGGKADAASRAMAAAKADDAKGFAAALTDFVELCMGGEY